MLKKSLGDLGDALRSRLFTPSNLKVNVKKDSNGNVIGIDDGTGMRDYNHLAKPTTTTKQGGNTIPPRVNTSQNSNPTVSGTSNSGKNNSSQGTLTLDTPTAKYYRMSDGSTKVVRSDGTTNTYSAIDSNYNQHVTTTSPSRPNIPSSSNSNVVPPRANTGSVSRTSTPTSNSGDISKYNYTSPSKLSLNQRIQQRAQAPQAGFFSRMMGKLGNAVLGDKNTTQSHSVSKPSTISPRTNTSISSSSNSKANNQSLSQNNQSSLWSRAKSGFANTSLGKFLGFGESFTESIDF